VCSIRLWTPSFGYTTNYKPTIEQHDGLITIENVLILLSCIYVQKYDYMNNNYFLCLIDRAFTHRFLIKNIYKWEIPLA
jgi:hypothetical protein